MSGALAARPVDEEKERGRVAATQVKRYFAGRAPDWIEQQQQAAAAAAAAVPAATEEAIAAQVQRTAISAPVVVKRVADPRLARLAQRSGDREEAIEEHRQIRAAEVVVRRQRQREPGSGDESGSSSDESDEEAGDEAAAQEEQVDEQELQARRDALRERLRQQQQQEQELLAAAGDDEDEEGSSEYETDDSEDEAPGRPRLVKPVFVRKQERETIAAREAEETAEAAAEEERKARLTERQQETRQLLVQAIASDAAAAAAAAAPELIREAGAIDTGDEAEPDALDAWQRREAGRIRRDAAEREAAAVEAAERDKLRAMGEDERLAYLKAQGRLEPQGAKQKAKWKYLQKYWHKGAFFQSNPDDARGTVGADAIFARDFSGATGEDLFDKASLPAVMQVRNFGRSGRTKWTHLLAEDTSVARKEDEWYRRDEGAAGAVAGGYSRDAAAVPGYAAGGAKRGGDPLTDGFAKPKKFKT